MSNYSINAEKIDTTLDKNIGDKKIYHIWLSTPDGGLLVKNFDHSKKELHINDLTIQVESFSEAIKVIEKQWSILCDESSLEKVYSYNSNIFDDVSKEGYIITVNLTSEQQDLIAESSEGQFIDYRDFDTLIRFHDITLDFKEAFYSLLEYLEKNCNFEPYIIQQNINF